MSDQDWYVERVWCAVLAGVSDVESAAIRALLPEAVDLKALAAADIPSGPPCVVFADVADADKACALVDPRRIVFLCDSDRLATHSEALLRQPVRALLDRKQLCHSTVAGLVLGSVVGTDWNFDVGHILDEELVHRSITSSVDRDLFFKKIVTLFAERGLDAREAALLRLVTEELTTNALIHAFEEWGGVRYEPGDFEVMREGHAVSVEYGLNDTVFVLKVTDSAGSLDPEVVRKSLHRQFSGDGLLDTSGRGFFLGFSIATLFVVNIDPGVSTEVISVFFRDHKAGGNSLLINVNG